MLFNSQASQDHFVYLLLYRLLKKKDEGFYLEIGAGEPIATNNSYLFETNFKWKGVSIDISNSLVKSWKDTRQNTLLISDATKVDYEYILKDFPKTIDYLSLDIDEMYDVVLERIPFDKYTFKIITIEHDSYRFGTRFKDREREILTKLGYRMICSDVKHLGYAFEDWWVNPIAFPKSILSGLSSLDLSGKEHSTILKIISDFVSAAEKLNV